MKDRTLSPYWKNDLPPTTKRFKGLHIGNILENVFFRMLSGSNYEFVVFLGCKLRPIPLSDIRCSLKKIDFQYCVCVRLNISVVGGKWFCGTVTVGDHFPRIVFSLVKTKKCLEDRASICSNGIHCSVSTFY